MTIVQKLPIWFRLQALTGLILIVISLPLVLPTSAAIDEQISDETAIFMEINPAIQIYPSGCYQLNWSVEGVQAVYINDEGRAGAGIIEEEFCSNDVPTLRVTLTDDTEAIYTLSPTYLAYNPLIWLGGITAAILLALSLILLEPRLALIVAAIVFWQASWTIYRDYRFIQPLDQFDRILWHWLLILSLSLLVASIYTIWRLKDQPKTKRISAFFLFFVVQLPMPLLMSIPIQLRYEQLDALQNLLWISGFLIYALPVLLIAMLFWTPQAKLSSRLMNLVVAVFSPVFMLLVLELGLHLITPQLAEPESARFRIGVPYADDSLSMRPNTTWEHEYPSNPRGYFDDNNKIQYTTNSAGFRDREFSVEKTDSVTRIAFIGDSFGHGSGVWYDDMASVILEETLILTYGCSVEVYNFSVGGYNTPDQAAVIREIVPAYQPDIVVIWFFPNDIGQSASQYFGDEALFKIENPFFQFGREFSVVTRFTAQQLQQITQSQRSIVDFIAFYQNDELWNRMVESMEEITAQSNALESEAFLFIHPILYRLDDNHPYLPIHEQVSELAQDLGFQTYDLLEAFKGIPHRSLWVHEVDYHANEIGHRLAGEYAAEQLARRIATCQ